MFYLCKKGRATNIHYLYVNYRSCMFSTHSKVDHEAQQLGKQAKERVVSAKVKRKLDFDTKPLSQMHLNELQAEAKQSGMTYETERRMYINAIQSTCLDNFSLSRLQYIATEIGISVPQKRDMYLDFFSEKIKRDFEKEQAADSAELSIGAHIVVVSGKYLGEQGTIAKVTAKKYQLKLDSGATTASGKMPMVKHSQVAAATEEEEAEAVVEEEAEADVEEEAEADVEEEEVELSIGAHIVVVSGKYLGEQGTIAKVTAKKYQLKLDSGATTASGKMPMVKHSQVAAATEALPSEEAVVEEEDSDELSIRIPPKPVHGPNAPRVDSGYNAATEAPPSTATYDTDEDSQDLDELSAGARIVVVSGKYLGEQGTIAKVTAKKYQLELDSGKTTASGKMPMVKHSQVAAA